MNSSLTYQRLYPVQQPSPYHWPDLDSSATKLPPTSTGEGFRRGPSGTSNWLAPFRDGLPTPPNYPKDMAGLSLNQPPSASYGAQQSNNYPDSGYGGSSVPSVNSSRLAYPNAAMHSTTNIYQTTVKEEPRKTSSKPNEASQHRPQKNAIAPNLQIPASINDSKGSLAEFAAQITCLLWFESTATLQRVEDAWNSLSPVQPLASEAMPTMGFRKWVTTILSTTQVTQSVVVLALLFIYRLKKFNPTVRGKPGSEYRLLTVALMLGNKFLDDNTYTNKTWAEVSGISVQEIHIMEVEFLSNMRYNLFTSVKDWSEWHNKLDKIWMYFDRVSKVASQPPRPQPPPPQGPLTPTLLVPPALPSPPESTRTSPPYLSNQPIPLSWPQPQVLPPFHNTSPSRHYHEVDPIPAQPRKRSYDEQVYGPPAKRPTRSSTPLSLQSTMPQLPHPDVATTLPRLPGPSVVVGLPPARLQPLDIGSPARLPPPGSRAMATVYNAAYSQPQGVVHSNTPTPQPLAVQTNFLPSISDHPGSRHQSPYLVSSAMSSPIAPLAHSVQQSRPSPSYFLTHRQSPYRPVQAVNRLLHPPPSMHGPPPNLSYQNLQYQPLGKQADYRTGIAYDMGNWPHLQGPQSWPALPQPT